MSVRHGGLREHGPAARFLIPDSTVDEAVRRKRGTPPGAGPSTPLRSAARCAPPLALPDAASLRALRADDAEPEVVATHAEADSARTVRARGAVRRAALPAQAEVTGVAVPVDLAGLAAEADLVGGYALRTDVARAARDLEERGAAREEGAAVAFGRTAGLGEPWHHRAGRHRRVERRAVALLGGSINPSPQTGAVVPHWFGTPPPPHVCRAGHTPHEPPQPSSPQVLFAQLGVQPHTLGVPPPPQV